MAGNLNLRNHFFGLNKQEILIRHEQLINDGRAAGTTQVGPENVQDIMRVIDPENTQKGIGSSDIILGEDVRDILENDNFIVAEIIKNWGDAQGRVAIFALVFVLILRHYVKIPQWFIYLALSISFVLSLMNMNAVVYLIPIWLIEYLY